MNFIPRKKGADRDFRIALWVAIFVVALATAVALTVVPSAQARWQNQTLNAFASHFAKRAVTVECSSTFEDGDLFYENPNSWSLGYVYIPTGEQNETFVWDGACLGALAIDLDAPDVSDYMKVIGFSAVLHESFHLRRMKGNQNEAKTECRSMQNYDKALVFLGAEPEVLDRLMPIALLEHFRFRALAPSYNRVNCNIPHRFYKYIGIGG